MTNLGLLKLPHLDIVLPETVEEAVKLLEEGQRLVLAGGTYTISSIIQGTNRNRRFVDISRLAELNYIHEHGDKVEAGALVTHAQLIEKLGTKIPAFRSFQQNYTSPSIANRATLGGSIMLNNSSEDLIPIMLVLDAELIFQTGKGEVRLNISDHVQQKAQPRMLLRSVKFESSPSCYFDKLWLGISRIPLISVALKLDAKKDVKVAVSHKDGYKPGRVYSVERYLKEHEINQSTAEKACRLFSQSINPPSDVMSSAWYRREVAGVLLKRLLERAGG